MTSRVHSGGKCDRVLALSTTQRTSQLCGKKKRVNIWIIWWAKHFSKPVRTTRMSIDVKRAHHDDWVPKSCCANGVLVARSTVMRMEAVLSPS
jgi:hypothetical protein